MSNPRTQTHSRRGERALFPLRAQAGSFPNIPGKMDTLVIYPCYVTSVTVLYVAPCLGVQEFFQLVHAP